jgi:bifunctional non-homologous end joining protein LigD
MVASVRDLLPAGDDWTYEVKWDGYRALLIKDGARVRLISRNLKSLTNDFPAIASAGETLNAETLMIDGELVAVDEHGRPSFQALQHRRSAQSPVIFYAFDLLHRDGRDFAQARLDDRRAELARLSLASPLFRSDPLPGTVQQIEAAVRNAGLEGVVAKRRSSRYEAGRRSDAWVKVKFSPRQEFVVGGYKPDGRTFDSVLVGYFEGRELMYAGKVRAGFTPHTRAALFTALEPLSAPACPFANLPTTRKGHWGEGVTAEDMKTIRWVKPRIVVEVAFTEWTRDLNLRHAAFVGVRRDKPPRDVTRESGINS